MWEQNARRFASGEASLLAPLYPASIAGLVGLTGLPWDRAGLAIAVACYAALGPLTWVLARRLGASPWLAGLGGLLALIEPWIALSALQVQPDTLSALAFLVALLTANAWIGRPDRLRLGALLVVIALVPQVREHAPQVREHAPQVREHAPVVAAGLLVLLAVAPGGLADRVQRLALAGILMALVPTLLSEFLVLPWQQQWVRQRWGEVLGDFFSSRMPAFLEGSPRHAREAFEQAYAAHDHLRIAWLHIAVNFHQGPSPWFWVALGAVGWLLLGRRRWVMMIGFLPLLAVPGGAQQPRQVAVIVPIAAACWVAGAGRLWRLGPKIALVGGLGLLASIGVRPGAVLQEHIGRCQHRLEITEYSRKLCERLALDAAAVGGDPRPLIYCERPSTELNQATHSDGPLFYIGDLRQQHRREWVHFERDGWAPLAGMEPPVYVRPRRGSHAR